MERSDTVQDFPSYKDKKHAAEGRKNVDITKIYPLIYRSLTSKEFTIPIEWKVAWTAKGHIDSAWEVSGEIGFSPSHAATEK